MNFEAGERRVSRRASQLVLLVTQLLPQLPFKVSQTNHKIYPDHYKKYIQTIKNNI